MEFKHIEYFIETCNYKSITKAAEALYISQQALSRCIANMEKELGVTLLNRTVKGITLTENGRYLYDTFAPQIGLFKHTLEDVVSHFDHKPETLTFSCAPLIFRCLSPDLLFEFREKYPHITLEQLEGSDRDCTAYVEADPQHFGMLAIPEYRHGIYLPFTPVKTVPLRLFVHKDHPLAALEVVNFAQLKDIPFLVMDKNSYHRLIILEYASKYHFSPEFAYETSDINQLFSLANKGRGVLLSIEAFYNPDIYEDLVMLSFDDPKITWSIAFIHQKREQLSATAEKFIQFICESVKK